MAILGGVGNPVGGSFTGPAEALEVIGDHAFAYSGMFGGSLSSKTALSFTTGNYYFVGQTQVNMAFEYESGDTPNTLTTQIRIKLNGSIIAQVVVGLQSLDSQSTAVQDIIIPPYTQVEVDIVADGDVANRLMGCTMTGRIYRTRD